MMHTKNPRYWRENLDIQNFGDFLSQYLFEKIFFPSGMDAEEIRIIGSCIDDFVAGADGSKKIIFWGCGVRDESFDKKRLKDKAVYLAVRGYFSQSVLELDNDVAIGDPGLLIPLVYTPKYNESYANKSVLIPHFNDSRSDDELKIISKCDLILRPNIDNKLESVEKFIDCLYSSEFLLCGSLHAAIVAAAYKKKFAYWNSGCIDLPFKWMDFSSSIEIPCDFFENLSDASYFFKNNISGKIRYPLLSSLLLKAPYPVRSEIFLKSLAFDFENNGEKVFEIRTEFNSSEDLLKDITQRNKKIVEHIKKLELDLSKETATKNEVQSLLDKKIIEVDVLDRNFNKINNELILVYESSSWKFTKPLRKTKDLIINNREKMEYFLKLAYAAIPLSPYNKSKLKNILFSKAKWLFFWTSAYNNWNRNSASSHITSPKRIFNNYDDIILSFDKCLEPTISIIIPVYNNWGYTERCLKSIKKDVQAGGFSSFEIIVADDGSKDETKERIKNIPGVVSVVNEKNLGFLRNCNNAAKYAKGKYILLLNNDTEVSEGWLDKFLYVFSNFDNVGIVAGKLIYPDGRVQEAGGVMMQNGWGHPYARFDNPDKYNLNYIRQVSCAIGACFIIDRQLFNKMGGFDEIYAPAHYEEFDLEFSIQAAGYRMMYQPSVEIIHHESVSGGGEFRDKQSLINHEKFSLKWKDRLNDQPSNVEDPILYKEFSKNKKKILLIEDMVPHHDKHAGGLTIYQYIFLLKKLNFDITFYPDDLRKISPYTEQLQQAGIEVVYGDIDFKSWFSERSSFFEYCWVCRPDVAIKYIEFIRNNSKSKIIYYTHDLHFVREKRSYELHGNEWNLKESIRLERVEKNIFNAVDIILTPSESEKYIIKSMTNKGKVLTIPPYIYSSSQMMARVRDFESRKNIMFLGGFAHQPNVDAVEWFLNDIFPLIRERLPSVEFNIVGSGANEYFKNIEINGVNLIGYVENLTDVFQDTKVFVAPLRYGAGVKGKIVSSLLYGVPVVTTSVGNEGIELVNGEQIYVADSAEGIADYVVKLYTESDVWNRISTSSMHIIHEKYSLENAEVILNGVFE